MAIGCLYGVGVGPGDPELLTLRAARIVQQVPVVVVPRKTSRDTSYAYSIVADLVDANRQEVLSLVFPMKKDLGELREYWREAVETIHGRLMEGKDCAFLTEGDPLLFGTFIYVYRMFGELHPEVPVRVVPGVSSLSGSAAQAVVPLASADERLAIIPATYEVEKIKETLREFDTVVLLKVHSVFDRVLDILEELHLVDGAIYVKKCTARDEEIVRDIRVLRGRKLDYLSLLIVRKKA